MSGHGEYMKIRSLLGLAHLLLALVIIAGCEKKEEAKSASQVVAKVNADEITVYQVNNILARAQNITPEIADNAKRKILDKLIDQQLAKQQAIAIKLDRSPEVVQSIEAARNEILAHAYLGHIAAEQPKPTAAEVKKYYATHPELFAQRRIFNLEEIVVVSEEGLAPKLREQVAKANGMQDIMSWLRSQNIKFAANSGARAAEVLPMDLLLELQTLGDGAMRLIESGGSLRVFHVVATQAAPVDEAAATPRIQQFLFNQHMSQIVAAEMKRLKDMAEISFAAEVGKAAIATESKSTANVVRPKPERPPAQLPVQEIDAGVSGLK